MYHGFLCEMNRCLFFCAFLMQYLVHLCICMAGYTSRTTCLKPKTQSSVELNF